MHSIYITRYSRKFENELIFDSDKSPREIAKSYLDLIKTHNDTSVNVIHEQVVNLVGHLIRKKTFKKEDFEIIDLDRNYKILTYDDNGLIEDWEIGFYSWHLDEEVQ